MLLCNRFNLHLLRIVKGIAHAERDGTRAETKFRLSPKRMSPFKSVGASVQSTAGSRGVRISLSNAGYTTFGGGVRILATHSIREFPLHFSFRVSPCATRFRKSSKTNIVYLLGMGEYGRNYRLMYNVSPVFMAQTNDINTT